MRRPQLLKLTLLAPSDSFVLSSEDSSHPRSKLLIHVMALATSDAVHAEAVRCVHHTAVGIVPSGTSATRTFDSAWDPSPRTVSPNFQFDSRKTTPMYSRSRR